MNILTFDIEDWFHFLDHPSTQTELQWVKFESRVVQNLERILQFLEERSQSATFFIIGWVAQQHPEIVKMIDKAGHEIGLHSYRHQLIWQQTPEQFRQDVQLNMQVLEEMLGRKINIYRAPGFSIKKHNMWAIEVLDSLGITTDASIFPALRAHGGIRNFPANGPCRLKYKGSVLKEFPVNYMKLAGLRTAFSGGGFFRFWPYPVIRQSTAKAGYVMSYFHPRDFDTHQPMLSDLDMLRRFRAYYGLNGSMAKLGLWLDEFQFTDIRTADAAIDWEKTVTVEL